MGRTASDGQILRDNRNVGKVLARVGDRWSVLVIVLLGSGTRRFNEIKRSIEGISQQMLTRTLRGLERDGIVKRTILPSSPPQVEYALTSLGGSLSKPVLALGQWACEHIEEVNEAQKLFEERQRRAD
jgi:DNA-binding HxlR family transcriptional regulator